MLNAFKEQLIKNNFVFEEITNDVLLIKNFLTKNDLDFIKNIINTKQQSDWEIEYTNNLKRFCLQKFGRDDVDNLISEGKFEVTQNWADKNLNIKEYEEQNVFYERLENMVIKSDPSLELSGLATIQRMQEGVELKYHADQQTDPSIRFATILYVNDDYNGGELFFQNLNISLKPNSGDLLFFPGDKKHEHGVRPVKNGPIRYVIVGFIKERDHYLKNSY